MSLSESNLLAHAASPYLRQHAENPVHWRPWSAEALAEAKERDRPILLSVGYAACHWCHVMAHESFEDREVAALMNRLFVNIKVDREERPDIDQIYMAALTALGEQGGWPLTMFLTPDGAPIWGGTYFPPEPRYGRPGFPQILEAVARAWQQERPKLLAGSVNLKSHLADRLDRSAAARSPSPEDLRSHAGAIGSMIDRENGGLRGAPKFPNAPFMTALWLDGVVSGTPASQRAVIDALKAMTTGGIYDHVGGGMARYSTDQHWLVPHFEKMLYDNAQLIRLCNWAFAATGDKTFRDRIEETVRWIASEMTVSGGGFASSLDADSEGEEGRFYTWTHEQLAETLGPATADFLECYELVAPADWHGDPILRRRSGSDLRPDMSELLERLRRKREARVRPGRDDKVLVDWASWAITAIAEAAAAFKRSDWLELASDAYQAIKRSADPAGRLPHAIHSRGNLFPALSIDYGAMITASLALHAATGDALYLQDAAGFLDQLDRWHGDQTGEGYYLTASDAGDVPLRIRGDVDEAIPSANAVIIEALARLATLSADESLLDKAWRVASAAMGRVSQQSFGQTGIVNASAILINAQKLLIVDDREQPSLVPVANRYPDPRRVVVIRHIGAREQGERLPGGIRPDLSKQAAYLCEGQTCRPPIYKPAELEAALAVSALT